MSNWIKEKEVFGSLFLMKFAFLLYRFFRLKYTAFFLHPIIFFYYCFAVRKRKYSQLFLKQVYTIRNTKIPFMATYKHFYSYGLYLIEKMAAWNNDMSVEKMLHENESVYNEVISLLKQKKGLVLIGSHLGNIELLRALAMLENHQVTISVTVIQNLSRTAKFTSLLSYIQKKANVNIIDSNTIGIDTIFQLQQRIENGEIIVIAGDRVVDNNKKRDIQLPFLNKPTGFPYGAFLIPVLLKHPVYYFFAVRNNDVFSEPYVFSLIRSDIAMNKKSKSETVHALCKEFVGHLEKKALTYPLQWYNFYNFWGSK